MLFSVWGAYLSFNVIVTTKLLKIVQRSVLIASFIFHFAKYFLSELAPILNTYLWCFSTYASKYIPIIASVSEHQPPTWPSYFMDINVLAFLVPAGIIVSSLCTQIFCLIFSYYSVKFLTKSHWFLLLQACFSPLSDASSFVILYIVTSVYFSGVMVRNYWDCRFSTYNIFLKLFYWNT